jgi:hypothetical protein
MRRKFLRIGYTSNYKGPGMPGGNSRLQGENLDPDIGETEYHSEAGSTSS